MRTVTLQDPAWIKQAKENLRDLYEGRPLMRMPFEFVPYTDIKSKLETDTVKRSPVTVEEYNRHYFDHELALQEQLKLYEDRSRSEFRDDSVLAITPMNGAMGWFNEFFGGKNEWFNNRPPFPYHIISEVSQIDSLKPDISKGDLFRLGLEQMRYFAEEVGDKIPVQSLDLQSPINFASILIDYTKLLYMMIDAPEKVHQLMRMITETLIVSMRMIRKEMVADWPLSQFGWWMPKGVLMADDLMAVLNPELYAEFGKPYNAMIAEEFGAVSVHSCGKIEHNLENVASTRGIVALNTHEPLAVAAPIIKNRLVLIVGGVKNSVAPNYPGSTRDNLKTGEEVTEFWWNDFIRIAEFKEQRLLYQCHALLGKKRTAQDVYDKMLDFSNCLVNGDLSEL